MKKTLFLVLLLMFTVYSNAQEICGNGIDDDGDGLIDCLDTTDCISSIVPIGATFNTATNGTGGVLPGGSNDIHWQISIDSIAGPYTPAIVMSSIPGSYYTSPWPDCNWISHASDGVHIVSSDFYYKTEFYLPCYTTCGISFSDSATFCLSMDFYADNSVDEVYVNGVPQSPFLTGIPAIDPYSHYGFIDGGGLSFSLCRNWQPGLNVLIIKVSSGPSYEGFLAQGSTTIPGSTTNPAILSPHRNYTTCNTAPINFTAASPGGNWSATCGECIDSLTGVFDPIISGVGNYTVTYTLTSPCLAEDTTTIHLIATPDATIYPPAPQCTNNSPFNLSSATAGGTWAGTGITDASAGTFDPSIAGAGTFTITHSFFDCSDTATAHVIVHAQPVVVVNSPAICMGSNAILSATGAGSYIWSTGETTSSVSVAPIVTTLYQVIGTSSTGCVDSATATVSVAPARPVVFIGNDTAYCGITIPRILDAGMGEFTTYLWQGGTTDQTFTATTGGDYYVGVTNSCGTTYDTIHINVIPYPVVTANSTSICIGNEATLIANGATNYLWSTSDTTASITIIPSETTTYTVMGAVELGCSDTATALVTVVVPPVVTLSSDTTIIAGAVTTLSASGGTGYNWSPSDNLSCTDCPNPIASPSQTTTYCVVVNNDLCASISCLTVNVEMPCPDITELQVPDAFSPNNDDNNDLFYLQGWHGCVKEFNILIYDRWGEKVFESNDVNFSWDGIYKGKVLETAVFVYCIKAKLLSGTNVERKGNITLIR